MTLRIVVTGSQGQLGRSLQLIAANRADLQFTFLDRSDLDFLDAQNLKNRLSDYDFDILVNCAAYTAVDKAEEEQSFAYQVNSEAVGQLAEICLQKKALLIHFSTDYVFDGCHSLPFLESHPTNPQSIYGKSKLAGEAYIQSLNCKAIIIRTSWVYSEFGNNFVKTMLRLGSEREELGVIYDQIGAPTYAADLAQAVMQIIDSMQNQTEIGQDVSSTRLFHFSNEGVCSWYDFAYAIFEMASIQCKLKPIETKDYPTPAKRPQYSVLNKASIKNQYQMTIPYWKHSLESCIRKIQERNA